MVMYKIDRRGGAGGGVQKSFSRTDPLCIFRNQVLKKKQVMKMITMRNCLNFEDRYWIFEGTRRGDATVKIILFILNLIVC